ncbi:MAG: ATP-binding cassette domain-containing protein [Myxococcales bacterium]|nr:ATP-binding cassette domain-containing protein [Myxococcales bacterium]
MSGALAELRDVSVHFPIRRGLLQREVARVRAVDGVSLSIERGEVLGLVGESGSGKSTAGRALLRLTPPTSGTVWFDGADVTRWSRARLLPMRRRLQVVFQDPDAALDPRMRVGESVAEPLDVHLRLSWPAREAKVAQLFEAVGLDAALRQRWPHEFSGGQRQRVGIARALATDPDLVVLDEPVSALDVSVQAQVLNLLADLRQQRGLAYLFIAHDLGAVAHLADRVAVMYLGRIVEIGPAENVLAAPRHPYTQALLRAVPRTDPVQAKAHGFQVLEGEIPNLRSPPTGCAFHPRCPAATPRCRVEHQALRPCGTGSKGVAVACWQAQ